MFASLFFNFCRSFENPTISNDERRNGEDALGLGILKHLRMKHGDSDSSTTVEMRMDVFRHIFRGKGRISRRKGWHEFEDFSLCRLPFQWEKWVNHLGDGKKINFPILARSFLHWGPKAFTKNADGQIHLLPRYYCEKLNICFSTSAYTVN